MMYEAIPKSIIAWALNNYISYHYFDNVNVSQLKVALEDGEVELKNLPIKREALQHLNLPMDVVSGEIESLSIKLPLTALLTEPWIIKITNVMLVVTSKDDNLSTTQDITEEEPDSFLHDYKSEETVKLVENYSTFSEYILDIVQNIYKNIKLQVEAITILFEDLDYGLVKLTVDHLLLHRPGLVRNLVMENVSINISGINDDFLLFNLQECKLNLQESTLEVQQQEVEGFLIGLTMSESREKMASKQNILRSERIRVEVKLNSSERSLQIKTDLLGLQYIHSQRFYELTNQGLRNFIKLCVKLQKTKRSSSNTAFSKMLIINIEDGSIHLIDDMNSMPMLEFSLQDCRILQFSGKHQRNGLVYGKVGCNNYNRDESSWDNLLEPWPFNLSWDNTTTETKKRKQVFLNSDEYANICLSNAFSDICDVTLKRFFIDIMNLIERKASRYVDLYNNHLQLRETSDFNLKLPGFKMDLVDNTNEKFLEISLEDIAINYRSDSKEQVLDCSVKDVKIDNLLQDCEKSTVLDRADLPGEKVDLRPALRLVIDKLVGSSVGITFFRQVQVSMCELVLNIEESLVIKLVDFFKPKKRKSRKNHQQHGGNKMLNSGNESSSKYYFDLLLIDLTSLKLSAILTCFGLKLRLEEMQLLFAPYLKMNVMRTFEGVLESVTRFYKGQFDVQKPWIYGKQTLNYIWGFPFYDEIYKMLFE